MLVGRKLSVTFLEKSRRTEVSEIVLIIACYALRGKVVILVGRGCVWIVESSGGHDVVSCCCAFWSVVFCERNIVDSSGGVKKRTVTAKYVLQYWDFSVMVGSSRACTVRSSPTYECTRTV